MLLYNRISAIISVLTLATWFVFLVYKTATVGVILGGGIGYTTMFAAIKGFTYHE